MHRSLLLQIEALSPGVHTLVLTNYALLYLDYIQTLPAGESVPVPNVSNMLATSTPLSLSNQPAPLVMPTMFPLASTFGPQSTTITPSGYPNGVQDPQADSPMHTMSATPLQSGSSVNSHSAMSPGAIVGLILGILVFCLSIAAVIVFWLWRRRRAHRREGHVVRGTSSSVLRSLAVSVYSCRLVSPASANMTEPSRNLPPSHILSSPALTHVLSPTPPPIPPADSQSPPPRRRGERTPRKERAPRRRFSDIGSSVFSLPQYGYIFHEPQIPNGSDIQVSADHPSHTAPPVPGMPPLPPLPLPSQTHDVKVSETEKPRKKREKGRKGTHAKEGRKGTHAKERTKDGFSRLVVANE